jgi:hypothetical protein
VVYQRAGVSEAISDSFRRFIPGSTASRYSLTGTLTRRQDSTIERIAATLGPACAATPVIQRCHLQTVFGAYSRRVIPLFANPSAIFRISSLLRISPFSAEHSVANKMGSSDAYVLFYDEANQYLRYF